MAYSEVEDAVTQQHACRHTKQLLVSGLAGMTWWTACHVGLCSRVETSRSKLEIKYWMCVSFTPFRHSRVQQWPVSAATFSLLRFMSLLRRSHLRGGLRDQSQSATVVQNSSRGRVKENVMSTKAPATHYVSARQRTVQIAIE